MEFGRVPENELDQIDFSLPADPGSNKKIIKGKPAKDPKLWLGCAKWGRTEWLGKLYPPRTREKDFLKYYADHYNSIELNATHHKLYGAKACQQWADKTKGKEFIFCPKMYKGITHAGKLGAKPFFVNEFFRGVRAFGNQLGPVFVQVNERFSTKRKAELFQFLETLPTDIQFFIEVRHPDWFGKKNEREGLFDFLREHKIGVVITDTAGRRDCAHMHLTIPKTFIRYVGNSLHPSDYERIDAWIDRIKNWLDKGMQEIYFFMHMHEEATSPELTVYMVDRLNKVCGLDLIKPKFIDENYLKR